MGRLLELAKEMDIPLTEEQELKLLKYCDLLLEWNQKINLTAITEREEVYVKHFLDSLMVLKTNCIKSGDTIIDVGSGAGFPGLPIAIVREDVHVTFADSLRKRIDFLTLVCNELGLSHVSFVHGRAEDLGRDKNYREKYTVAVARAVAALPILLEYTLPFVEPNGSFIAWKGPKGKEELEESGNALKQLGGRMENVYSYELGDSNLHLMQVKKGKPTPLRYPRQPKKIQTKPL